MYLLAFSKGRELEPALLQDLSRNPWQLYASRTARIYSFPEAAGGFVPYPNPRYAMAGGMQTNNGGLQ